MTLNMPNRLMWLLIGAVILFLLQSGCHPIHPPTPAAAAIVAAAAVVEEEARADMSTTVSTASTAPDGNWTATSLFQVPRDGDTYFQSLVVTHASGGPSYTVVEGEFPLGLGYTVTVPLAWSQDSARFYFTNRPQADGCGLLFNGTDLHRLDLASGERATLIPPDTTTTLALAPDEEHVAYLAIGEPQLILLNLQSGDRTVFDLDPLLAQDSNEARPQVGAFVWSPDSAALAFVVAHRPCVGGWAESSSIYVLDATSLSLTPHLEQDTRVLSPVAWLDVSTLLVERPMPFDQADAVMQFTLELASNSVAPVEE